MHNLLHDSVDASEHLADDARELVQRVKESLQAKAREAMRNDVMAEEFFTTMMPAALLLVTDELDEITSEATRVGAEFGLKLSERNR